VADELSMFARHLSVTISAVCLAMAPAFAAPPDAAPTAKAETKLPKWLTLTGTVRGRFESVSGSNLSNKITDDYYLNRFRLEVGAKPTPWLRFYTQIQDARVGGYNTPSPSSMYNSVDIRQGYVEATHEGRVNLTLTAGRQVLQFGAARMLGDGEWGNVARSTDAIDLTVAHGPVKLDFLAGSVVLNDPGRLDRHKPGEHLYGVYGAIGRVLPGLTIEPYLLFKQNLLVTGEKPGVGDAIVAAPGIRLYGKARYRLDYMAEFVTESGSYSADSISAVGGTYTAGWTINKSALKPRLSTTFSHSSGDHDAKDGKRETFDQFYGNQHLHTSMTDQVGWRNVRSGRAAFDFVPRKGFKFRIDGTDLNLASTQDGLYNSGGTRILLNRAATSGHIGSEVGLQGTYDWGKSWKFVAGMSHLFAGAYLDESKADFGYHNQWIGFSRSF
jgi:hypothetical protein